MKFTELTRSKLLIVHRTPRRLIAASTKVGTAFVDQFVATLQSPLTGFFQLIAVMSLPPLSLKTVSDLDAENRGLIDQKRAEKNAVNRPASLAAPKFS